MRHKDITAYSLSKSKPITCAIPEPVISGSISCGLSTSEYTDDLRIDTGADISVLPLEVKELLCLEDKHAIFEIEVSSIDGSETTLVFLVDFMLTDLSGRKLPFHDVNVIFREIDVPLLGIWTALEHAPPFECDFPRMTTTF